MAETQELQIIDVLQLTTAASQLEVTLKVDPDLLKQEIFPYMSGFDTLKLSGGSDRHGEEDRYRGRRDQDHAGR